MSKSSFPLAVGGAGLLAATATVVIPAPAVAASGCNSGKPSVLVHVAGFKQARGKVKVSVSLFGRPTTVELDYLQLRGH